MAGFQKKARGTGGGKRPPEIPGTKQSIKTFSLLTSSGIPSLDALLGGGFPLGSLVVLNQEGGAVGHHPDYTKVVLNHFLSAGLSVHGHDAFVASGANKPIEKVNILQPSASTATSKEEIGQSSKETDDNDLKIAWRYKDMKEANPSRTQAAAEPVKPGKTGSLFTWSADELRADFSEKSPYLSLFKSLHATADKEIYAGGHLPEGQSPNVLRIGLFDMDTVLMAPDRNLRSLLEFLFALKSMARHKLAVAVISLTANRLDDNPSLQQSLKELTDFWFDVNGFEQKSSSSGSGKVSGSGGSGGGGYHGFFTVTKLPTLKSLKCAVASSYGKYHFKSTKSKFVLEKIHLPPAEFEMGGGGGGPSQTQKDNKQKSAASVHAIGNDW